MRQTNRHYRWTYLRTMVGIAVMMLATGCAGTMRIGELLDDPTAYDGREVRVEGEVSETIGVPVVGGTYQIDDGTGSLRVVSDAGVPRNGARVSVLGTFRALFSIGAESLSVLQERDRDVR